MSYGASDDVDRFMRQNWPTEFNAPHPTSMPSQRTPFTIYAAFHPRYVEERLPPLPAQSANAARMDIDRFDRENPTALFRAPWQADLENDDAQWRYGPFHGKYGLERRLHYSGGIETTHGPNGNGHGNASASASPSPGPDSGYSSGLDSRSGSASSSRHTSAVPSPSARPANPTNDPLVERLMREQQAARAAREMKRRLSGVTEYMRDGHAETRDLLRYAERYDYRVERGMDVGWDDDEMVEEEERNQQRGVDPGMLQTPPKKTRKRVRVQIPPEGLRRSPRKSAKKEREF